MANTTSTSSSQTAQTAASHQNALSSRITSVLSASYSDADIRDALAILDEQNFQNTAEARRDLHVDIEEQVVNRNAEILDDFKEVADELLRVEAGLSRLSATCSAIRAQVERAKTATGPLFDQASTLLDQKRETESKQRLLHAFQKFFILSEEETRILTSNAQLVNQDFCAALEKVKLMHTNSHVLLSCTHDDLGLSILQESSRVLNAAYQNLFLSTQRAFRALDLENPHLNVNIRQALRLLADRPALFNSSLDNFAATRQETLSSSFYHALTGQGDEAIKNPIEVQAHDPLRYISDMLAWLHSATVSEREALEVLFIDEAQELAKGIKQGRDNDIWTRNQPEEDDVTFDGPKALSSLVSRNLSGVARQLRQRIQQVIQGLEEAIMAYRVANILAFYQTTLAKLVEHGADIILVLTDLETAAHHQFRENMSDKIAAIPLETDLPSNDTSPPGFLVEALESVKTLVQIHQTSIASSVDAAAEMDTLLSLSLDPFFDAAQKFWQNLSQPQASILGINCLLQVRSILPAFTCTQPRLTAIDESLQSHAQALEDNQYTFLFESSGLAPLLGLVQPIPSTDITALSEVLVPDVLQTAGQQLDDFLPSALMNSTDRLQDLQNTVLASRITEAAANRFCDEFEILESRILALGHAQDSGDAARANPARLAFPRSTQQIRVLLS